MASDKRNISERLRFVKIWADYMKKTPNSKWSRQQNILINSVMKSANQDIKLYLNVKKASAKYCLAGESSKGDNKNMQ